MANNLKLSSLLRFGFQDPVNLSLVLLTCQSTVLSQSHSALTNESLAGHKRWHKQIMTLPLQLQKQLEKQRKKEEHKKAKLKLQAATTRYVAVKLRVMDPTVPLHWGGISAMPCVELPHYIKLRLNVLQKFFDKCPSLHCCAKGRGFRVL